MDDFTSIDYEYARELAHRLSSLEKDCLDAEGKLNKVLSELTLSWEGSACEAFEDKLKREITDISKLRDDLDTIANKIRKVVKSIKEADDKARKLAEELNASIC